MTRIYTCKRKINRWPMIVFFNAIDCAAVASYVTWTTKNPDWNRGKNFKRRLFLKELGTQLIEPALRYREANLQAMRLHVKLAFKALGKAMEHIPANPDAQATPPISRRMRCLICPKSKDKKVSIFCSACDSPCCKEHGQTVCDNCHVWLWAVDLGLADWFLVCSVGLQLS